MKVELVLALFDPVKSRTVMVSRINVDCGFTHFKNLYTKIEAVSIAILGNL
jgi:hypothetical protein